LAFSDGSLASLIYTAIGSGEMEKERLEVFAGNSSFVLNDYYWLESYGYSLRELVPADGKLRGNRFILQSQDKGWEQELVELARSLRGEESALISFEEAVRAMLTTFEVERQIRGY
jgi:hypothetical protein